MTGWPPGLLQDDCRKLSKWLAGKPDARYIARKNIDMTDTKNDPHAELMRLADSFATTKPGGLAVTRRDALDAFARTLTDRLTQAEQENAVLDLTMDQQTVRIAELEALDPLSAAAHWHFLYQAVCLSRKDDAARYGAEIQALEAQLEAVGAGGVGALPPKQCAHQYHYFGTEQKRRRCNWCDELEPVQPAPAVVGPEEFMSKETELSDEQIKTAAGNWAVNVIGEEHLLRISRQVLAADRELRRGDAAIQGDGQMSDPKKSDELILGFDAFEGDFGTPGDKVFSNKMVIARKEGPCAHCGLQICKGERVRSQSSKFDDELMSHRWCALCCAAMANYYPDDEDRETGVEYEARSGLAKHTEQPS